MLPRHPSALAVACALALAACGSGSSKKLGSIGTDCAAGRDAACASSSCLSSTLNVLRFAAPPPAGTKIAVSYDVNVGGLGTCP